jgi:hypothetical protein
MLQIGKIRNLEKNLYPGEFGEFCPILTLNMLSHNRQNSTNSWISWAFSLTKPNPEYGQS